MTDTPWTGSPSSSTSPSASGGVATSTSPFESDERSPFGDVAEPPVTPRRAALVLAIAVVIAAAIVAVLVTRANGAAPDGAARLVPPDALLYAHAGTSDTRKADRDLRALAARLGTPRAQLARLAASFTPAAGRLDFARDVRPWLGNEAGVALLDGGPGRPEPMLVAAVADRGKAEAMLSRLGATPAGSEHGIALHRLPPSATAAFAGTYLVVGPDAAVRAAVDRAAPDGGPSLADARVYRDAMASGDRGAAADLFAPAAGLRRLLDGRSGLAGIAGRLLAGPQLAGVLAQAKAVPGGLRLTGRALRTPGGAPRAEFAPSLTERAPAGAAAFLDLPGLGAMAGVVARAGGAGFVEGLRRALPAEAGMELDDLLAPLAGEAALTVASGQGAPVLTLAARTSDEPRTRTALAQLQTPLAGRLAPGGAFSERDALGVPAFTLDVTPELQPSYALSDGVAVASSARSGLEQLRPARTPVSTQEALRQVAPEKGAKVEALGFLEPRQLLALGEQGGLAALSSPVARDDVRRIRAAGVSVEEDANHPTDTTAELFLQIP